MNIWKNWNSVVNARGKSKKLFKRNVRCNCRLCEVKGELVIFKNLQQLRWHMEKVH